jgi:hypothetical protein
VSDEGLTTRLWPMVRSTQPQAMAVVYSERLPSRRHQALGDASWHTEGAETVTEVLQSRLLRQVEGLEAAWCASAADASLLEGLGTGIRAVSRLGPPMCRPGAGQGVRRPGGRGPGGDRQLRRLRATPRNRPCGRWTSSSPPGAGAT